VHVIVIDTKCDNRIA